MSRYLLDTNVLIALIDIEQPFHQAVTDWFAADLERNWLTCPITENGSVRILSLPNYPNPQPISETIESLRLLTTLGHHERIPDDVSLLGAGLRANRIRGSGQITDTYLAMLAQAHGAILATLDRRLSVAALRQPAEIFQIPT